MRFAARRQQYDDAIRTARRKPIKLEDSPALRRTSASGRCPVRQYLGAVLLLAGRPADAETGLSTPTSREIQKTGGR